MKKLYGIFVFTLLAGFVPQSIAMGNNQNHLINFEQERVELCKEQPMAQTPKGRELICYIEYKISEHNKLDNKLCFSYENASARRKKAINDLFGRFSRLN